VVVEPVGLGHNVPEASVSPFKIDGPAYISFSGGRTSALMLWKVLRVGLAPDVHVLFANTGKERDETLLFINECQSRWRVDIRWLERAPGGGFNEVGYGSASRRGQPFEQLISERGYVPHPGSPYCSTELKARVMGDFMQAQGYDEWDAAVGMRFDERKRAARIRGKKIEGGHVLVPLFDAGIHGGDVETFWREQPFDLRLHPHEGNCDLCFKKAAPKVVGAVDRDASRAEWWAAQERRTGTQFRNDRPSYVAMLDANRRQVRLNVIDDGGEPCEVCT